MQTFPAPTAPAPQPAGNRNRGIAVTVGVIVALAFLGGAFLLGRAGGTPVASASSPRSTVAPSSVAPASSAVPGPSTTVGPAGAPNANTPAAPAGGNGGAPSAPQPKAPPAPQAPAAPKPVITAFTTPDSIDCHNGNSQTFTASWATTNATKVTISIDGPGVYKTYGPTGSDSLPFDCTTPHTFLLTAYGSDGSTVSRSITLQPRNVQQPDMGDELDEL